MSSVRLAVMLKAPVAGTVKTRLAAEIGAERACAVHRQLAERQLRSLPPEIHATVYCDPPGAVPAIRAWLEPFAAGPVDFRPQCGGDLGARLVAAFAHAFSETGRAKVIALGGDCPALAAGRLRAAADALESNEVVIGPAADGGYYLIGLRRPCPELFADIDWGSSAVLAQTRSRIAALRLKTTELPVAHDVDDRSGWMRALAAGLLPPLDPVSPAPHRPVVPRQTSADGLAASGGHPG